MLNSFPLKVLLVFHALSSSLMAADIYIGVLAFNGKPQAFNRWQPTADYLTQKIPQHQFHITPLALDEFEHYINKSDIDFVLTNPSHYVRLEVQFGATRMATFLARDKQQILNTFSAVMFTKANNGIENIQDLKGKRFAAVKQSAFGGFQLAQFELLKNNINVLDEMDMLWMGFPHVDLVKSVLNETSDVTTVRSGLLESMVEKGDLDLKDIKILAQKTNSKFPYLRSFDLYPEWPIAKLPKTNNDLAKAVSVFLMQMPENDIAAKKSGGAGWTIPLNYASVHQVLKRIQAKPYLPVPITWHEVWGLYHQWIIVILALFIACIIFMVRFYKTNQNLKRTKNSLETHQLELEHIVSQRTDELKGINENLQQEISEHIKAEDTLEKGCEVLHEIHNALLRSDLNRKQRLASMVDSLRHYLGYEFALLSTVDGTLFSVCSKSPSNSAIDSPLSNDLIEKSIAMQSVYYCETDELWSQYVACPIYTNGQIQCVLELASKDQSIKHKQLTSQLSKKILYLITQWLGSESQIMLGEKQAKVKISTISERLQNLTKRERQVVSLLISGESNKSMAKLLKLSVKTIEMHRSNALRKTQAKSSAELVQIAVNSGEF